MCEFAACSIISQVPRFKEAAQHSKKLPHTMGFCEVQAYFLLEFPADFPSGWTSEGSSLLHQLGIKLHLRNRLPAKCRFWLFQVGSVVPATLQAQFSTEFSPFERASWEQLRVRSFVDFLEHRSSMGPFPILNHLGRTW